MGKLKFFLNIKTKKKALGLNTMELNLMDTSPIPHISDLVHLW